jgi:hypothetical protein
VVVVVVVVVVEGAGAAAPAAAATDGVAAGLRLANGDSPPPIVARPALYAGLFRHTFILTLHTSISSSIGCAMRQ